MGPGSKMPSKRWPMERYAETIQRLIDKFNIWPVVFGGNEDVLDGNKLISMASDNVNIDLREIAPEIGKILGGSGGGRAKMTQCGGPNKDKINEALELAKQLTKKKLEK